MGFPFTFRVGFLFTIVLGIQLTISSMVMMSEAALLDEAIHLSDTVRAWGLEVARRQVGYYQEILRGGA